LQEPLLNSRKQCTVEKHTIEKHIAWLAHASTT
jgi:hypothetical protein